MIAESDYRRKVTELTTTVADQQAYDLPASVIDVRKAWIAGARYDWVSYDDMVELENDRLWLTTDGTSPTGVVTATDDTSGNPVLRFYPAPDSSGDTITIEESFQGTDIAYGGGATSIIPAHLVPRLLDGAVAEAYEASGRIDLAQAHEERYEDGIDKLRRFKNTRGGSGPVRIQLRR
jgi:hypothetical protein